MKLFLINFSNLKNKKENRQLQSTIAHHFSKLLFKKIYGIDSDIKKDKKGKPYIENSEIKLSISHCGAICAVLFNDKHAGVDIEQKKQRDYDKILKRLNIDLKDVSKNVFYQIWTMFEAYYKFDNEKKTPCKFFSFLYKDYVCSIASDDEIKAEIYEMTIPKNKSNDIKKFDFDDLGNTAKEVKQIKVKTMPLISF